MGAQRTEPESVLPLVRLVRDRVDASGLTLRSFSQERGIKYGTLRRYYDKKLPPLAQGLKPDTLKDIATALDLPLSQVQKAADQSVGRIYVHREGPDVDIFIASMRELSPEEQARTKAQMLKLLAEFDEDGTA